MRPKPRFEIVFSPGDEYPHEPVDLATRENDFPMPAQAWKALERERGINRSVLRLAGYRVRQIRPKAPVIQVAEPANKPGFFRRMISWARGGN